jgi:hypothetical protein
VGVGVILTVGVTVGVTVSVGVVIGVAVGVTVGVGVAVRVGLVSTSRFAMALAVARTRRAATNSVRRSVAGVCIVPFLNLGDAPGGVGRRQWIPWLLSPTTMVADKLGIARDERAQFFPTLRIGVVAGPLDQGV